MMRIITGTAKGARLETLEGENTRPTTERVKEAIFSAIQFEVEGCRVLDLFAGSGQMGLEALSRGATSCMFVDASQDAMAVVKKNAKKTGFFDSSRFLVSDYRNYIRKMAGERVFDLIFLDPPYADNCVGDAIERILRAHLAEEGCIFVCESGCENIFEGKEELSSRFEVKKSARYSKSFVIILVYRGE
jgi:16S rRNA (guanine(966)-N(2))-methyltransferase RsmD